MMNELFGVWYSSNTAAPAILTASLQSIQRALEASKVSVRIVTCPWWPVSRNPFKEVLAEYRLPHHMGIVLQLLKVLYLREDSGKKLPEYISCLEHDVLYPPHYFDQAAETLQSRPDVDGVWNGNYIGARACGWCKKNQLDQPTHQLTMRWKPMMAHLKHCCREYTKGKFVFLEPVDKERFAAVDFADPPAVHVNDTHHFTSHPNVFAQEPFATEHPHWGTVDALYGKGLQT